MLYSINDKELKYGLGTRFSVEYEGGSAVYKKDVEQLGLSSNAFNNTGIVSSFLEETHLINYYLTNN